MQEQYGVRLELERLVFSAAHFITYQEDICERLHGHNYHLRAKVHGALGSNQYVVDFVALRNMLQELVDRLDHRMLLPSDHPTIKVVEQDGEFHVGHGDRRWVFPVDDCVLLPVANTTSEMLARHLGMQLLEMLDEQFAFRPDRLRIEIDECDGQSAFWDWC